MKWITENCPRNINYHQNTNNFVTTSLFDRQNKENLYIHQKKRSICSVCRPSFLLCPLGAALGSVCLAWWVDMAWQAVGYPMRWPYPDLERLSHQTWVSCIIGPGSVRCYGAWQWSSRVTVQIWLRRQLCTPDCSEISKESAYSQCNKRCHRFPLKLTYGLSWQPWTHEDVKTF